MNSVGVLWLAIMVAFFHQFSDDGVYVVKEVMSWNFKPWLVWAGIVKDDHNRDD